MREYFRRIKGQFMAALIAEDPNPEYSGIDRMDGLTATMMGRGPVA